MFVRQKVTITEKITFADSVSRIRPPGCSNWPKIRKMTMTSQFSNTTSTSIFFWCCFVSLVKFSYWSKFHVNIVTRSGIMTIFFYKGLTRNWKSEILPSEFFPISGDWGQLWIPNLAQMSLIEYYWMLQNFRVTAFTVFELLRENQLGVGVGW